MKGITIDLVAARGALQSLTPRTVALISSIPDLDVPISNSGLDSRGSHDELASMAQRDRPALDTELQLGIDAFLDATEGHTAEDLLPWQVGSLSCASMTGLLIGEQLLHGYDMAQTLVASGPSRPNPPGWSLRPAYTVSIDLSEDGPVDCRLSGDPISWLLAQYGRVGWENLLRTGGVKMTYGDTTLGTGFKRLLRNP